MDDVLAYGLTKHQAMQIQSVCLYLCVTFLSKITDHHGTHILISMIYPVQHAQHGQYYQQNVSTLQWPKQIPLGPAA